MTVPVEVSSESVLTYCERVNFGQVTVRRWREGGGEGGGGEREGGREERRQGGREGGREGGRGKAQS